MNTLEHLQRIKTKCQELLAIAEKREQGPWAFSPGVYDTSHEATQFPSGPCLNYGKKNEIHGQYGMDADFAFIASCAGPAEAGWRATIAAIDSCLADDERYQEMYNLVNLTMIEQIITAWPEELL